MCSDGMLEEMEDRELLNIISLPQPDSKKIEILKGATKNNRDNHSAFLIHIVSIDEDVSDISKEGPVKGSCDRNKHLWPKSIWLILLIVFAILCLIGFLFFHSGMINGPKI